MCNGSRETGLPAMNFFKHGGRMTRTSKFIRIIRWILSGVFFFALSVHAGLSDYSAYFPFDGFSSDSAEPPIITWSEVGAVPDFDTSEKVAGAASSHALVGGSGWIIS